jgi:hypothetical protein
MVRNGTKQAKTFHLDLKRLEMTFIGPESAHWSQKRPIFTKTFLF